MTLGIEININFIQVPIFLSRPKILTINSSWCLDGFMNDMVLYVIPDSNDFFAKP